MRKKIIFFDADGTIIKLGRISPLTKEAFKKLRENGHILVLSTGRALPVVETDVAMKEMDFENAICSAGGTVVINHEIVFTQPMTKDSQKELIDYFDKNQVVYNMESNDSIWIKEGNKEKYLRLFAPPEKGTVPDEIYQEAVKRVDIVSSRTKEIDDPMQINFIKLHYYEANVLYDGKNCPLTYSQIEKDLGEKYKCVTLSISKLFAGGEICEKDISKEKGISVILDCFDVCKEDIYAIGDDYNDIEMLQFATTSIAMGHAPDVVKKHADFITEDIDNDGFYHAMKHYGLI